MGRGRAVPHKRARSVLEAREPVLGNVLYVWKDTRLISRAESVSTILSLALVGVMAAV